MGPRRPGVRRLGLLDRAPVQARGGGRVGRRIDADLSSTLFAVGALRIAGVEADDPAIRKALTFIQRCQNFARGRPGRRSAVRRRRLLLLPDGPGAQQGRGRGHGPTGRARYHSYGSATADGLRALLRCGLPADHPRVAASRGWLERHFSASSQSRHVRAGPRGRARRDVFLLCLVGGPRLPCARDRARSAPEAERVAWAEPLSRELIRRQRGDGTWTNRFTASKEDDPLVATSFAAGALGLCRTFLAR